MTHKEIIINLLKINGTMTQGALAEAMYGDKKHSPNIYTALSGLVTDRVILRTGRQPSYYSLSGREVVIHEKQTQLKKGTGTFPGMPLRMKQWRKLRH